MKSKSLIVTWSQKNNKPVNARSMTRDSPWLLLPQDFSAGELAPTSSNHWCYLAPTLFDCLHNDTSSMSHSWQKTAISVRSLQWRELHRPITMTQHWRCNYTTALVQSNTTEMMCISCSFVRHFTFTCCICIFVPREYVPLRTKCVAHSRWVKFTIIVTN